MSEFFNYKDKKCVSVEKLRVLTEAEASKIIHSSEPIDLATYNALQKYFILSPDNEWFAGENLGHSPNYDELAMHFYDFGGADWFRKTFQPRYLPYSEQKTKNK